MQQNFDTERTYDFIIELLGLKCGFGFWIEHSLFAIDNSDGAAIFGVGPLMLSCLFQFGLSCYLRFWYSQTIFLAFRNGDIDSRSQTRLSSLIGWGMYIGKGEFLIGFGSFRFVSRKSRSGRIGSELFEGLFILHEFVFLRRFFADLLLISVTYTTHILNQFNL